MIGSMNPEVELSSHANVDPLGPVFISYRQSDGTDIAVALAWSLRAAGVPVWHDQTDLPPGDTITRLREALASGLSGAILVVTPEISMSDVVRNIELPALLELSHHPSFTLSIVSTVTRDSTSDELDYSAPDRLLGTTLGTLAEINQKPGHSASARFEVAQAQARRRLEHLRPVIAAVGNELLLDVQSRVPPFAATYDAHLVVRLRPPAAGLRRPSRAALEDLQGFLGHLPQLIAIGGATSLNVRGGAHLSIACAIARLSRPRSSASSRSLTRLATDGISTGSHLLKENARSLRQLNRSLTGESEDRCSCTPTYFRSAAVLHSATS